VFAIDEAQFFGDLLEFCIRAADTEGKLVLVAGLDGDFRRQRFGQARAPSHCPGCTRSIFMVVNGIFCGDTVRTMCNGR